MVHATGRILGRVARRAEKRDTGIARLRGSLRGVPRGFLRGKDYEPSNSARRSSLARRDCTHRDRRKGGAIAIAHDHSVHPGGDAREDTSRHSPEARGIEPRRARSPIGPTRSASRPTWSDARHHDRDGPDASRSRSLVLSGSLALDTNRLAHVHTRFAGRGRRARYRRPTRRRGRTADGRSPGRSDSATGSRRGNSWPCSGAATSARRRANTSTPSPGCGWSRRRSHARRPSSRTRRLPSGPSARPVGPSRPSEIAVARVERTLRSWRLTDAEIAAIRERGRGDARKGRRRDPDREKSWARVELQAPLAGTILENEPRRRRHRRDGRPTCSRSPT